MSRLARNNADWYHLLDLCAVTDTLIADGDGLYHAGDFNDRLVLGLKGTMSEAELHLIRGRLMAGLLATVGATILLLAGDGLSGVGQTALAASGATADAPLVPLREVLMESAEGHETGAELFVAAMAGS